MKHFKLKTQKNILIITFDQHNKSANLLQQETLKEFKNIIHDVEKSPDIKGSILISGKKDFCLGADVHFLMGMVHKSKTAGELYNQLVDIQLFLHSFNKPIVTIINGQCLGGGFELALASHYRIGIENTNLKFALPEVKLGIMPGLGGTQRLPRLVGLEAALPIILKGQSVTEHKALSSGIIDELATSTQAAIQSAKQSIINHTTHPALKKIHPYHNEHMIQFASASALSKKTAQGCYPNVEHILQSIYEGGLYPIEHALKIETQYFVKTLLTPSAQKMIKTLYIDRTTLRKKAKALEPLLQLRKIGIVGGGFMGSAIAAHSLKQGISVILVEKDHEALTHTKQTIDHLIQKYPPFKLPKLVLTTSFSQLKPCNLILEAVYEDHSLKESILKKIGKYINKSTIVASNTSSIPISSLATNLPYPGQFVGIHFFSPVAKMELIEIIKGDKTTKKTCDQAKAFSSILGKTPILVQDTRGFYTSQIVMGYIYEAMKMLTEGISPVVIENAAKQIGMPTAPLALADEIGIDVAWHILNENQSDTNSPSSDKAVMTLINDLFEQRHLGRKSQRGFYDYTNNKQISTQIIDRYPRTEQPFEDIKSRLFHIQTKIANHIHNKGLISAPEANIGAILGLGFCPWTGGPIQTTD